VHCAAEPLETLCVAAGPLSSCSLEALRVSHAAMQLICCLLRTDGVGINPSQTAGVCLWHTDAALHPPAQHSLAWPACLLRPPEAGAALLTPCCPPAPPASRRLCVASRVHPNHLPCTHPHTHTPTRRQRVPEARLRAAAHPT
jgi:hypothetical protein